MDQSTSAGITVGHALFGVSIQSPLVLGRAVQQVREPTL
jgi:hypothetical protein